MSRCLRCGAGNEWIEPIAKEKIAPPRPKLEKARRFLEWQWGVRFGTGDDSGPIAREIKEGLAELDAAEGR